MSGADDFDGAMQEGEFDDLISLLRDGPIDLTDEKPSADLWAGISSELGLGSVSNDGESGNAQTRLAVAPDPTQTTAAVTAEADDSNVVSLSSRRPSWGRPAAILTLAAAVVLLLAVPVALSMRSGDDVELIAAAELELLEGQSGTAVVADLLSVDGDLVMDVDVPTDVGADEFLELWLLEVTDEGEVVTESLGRVDGSGRYDVPDDVDLERFTLVDISVELDDGNADHSGNSVVRGELA